MPVVPSTVAIVPPISPPSSAKLPVFGRVKLPVVVTVLPLNIKSPLNSLRSKATLFSALVLMATFLPTTPPVSFKILSPEPSPAAK